MERMLSNNIHDEVVTIMPIFQVQKLLADTSERATCCLHLHLNSGISSGIDYFAAHDACDSDDISWRTEYSPSDKFHAGWWGKHDLRLDCRCLVEQVRMFDWLHLNCTEQESIFDFPRSLEVMQVIHHVQTPMGFMSDVLRTFVLKWNIWGPGPVLVRGPRSAIPGPSVVILVY